MSEKKKTNWGRRTLIGFLLVSGVFIGFLVVVAIATPDEPVLGLSPTVQEVSNGQAYRNETVDSQNVTVETSNVTATNATASSNVTTTTVSETETSENAVLDLFDVSAESLTDALVDLFKEAFQLFDFTDEDSLIQTLWREFADPDGGWH